jgi:hypothetical protein
MEQLLEDYRTRTAFQVVDQGNPLVRCALTSRDVFEKYVFGYLGFEDHLNFGLTNRLFRIFSGIGSPGLTPPPVPCDPSNKSLAWNKMVTLPTGVPIADVSKLYRCMSGVTQLLFRGDGRLESLGNIHSLESLHTIKINSNCIQSLRGLDQCKRLSHLYLCNLSRIRDLEDIEGCSHLNSLRIYNCAVNSLDRIEQLPALKRLEISLCVGILHIDKLNVNIDTLILVSMSIERLDGLTRCRYLTSFEMDSCVMLMDTQGLNTCQCLEVLSLSNNFSQDNFRGLGSCQPLKVLTLHNNHNFEDVRWLSQCKTLTMLTVECTPSLMSIVLAGFDKLTFFRLTDCSVKSVTFQECDALESIQIENCTFTDNGTLGNCVGLRDLSINRCDGYLDMSNLMRCPYLSSVELRFCSNLAGTETLRKNGPTFKLFKM